MKKTGFLAIIAAAMLASCGSSKDSVLYKVYTQTSVPEEGAVNFKRITDRHDQVSASTVKRNTNALKIDRNNFKHDKLSWWVNPRIAVSNDGARIGYITSRNGRDNIMVKSATTGGPSIQRTFRKAVQDFTWSPDGKTLCFTDYREGRTGVYLVDAEQGTVVRQISSDFLHDYSGVMTKDGNSIFFHRSDGKGNWGLWSYDMRSNLFSSYSYGMTPCLVPNQPDVIYCARRTDEGIDEIWRINIKTGVEEVILSSDVHSYSTPQLSPDGKWLLVTGTSTSNVSDRTNLDVFAVRTDGSQLTQLTYHPGHDLSAVWAPDGRSIYFLSQRASLLENQEFDEAQFNVWKMDYNL